MQLDLGSRIERPFEVGLLAGLQRRDGALQQFHVQVVADLLDLAALFIAQQLAGAANLQIVGGQRESGAELLERLQRLEPLDRIGRHRLARRRDQVGVGAVVRAADAAAQLMDLRQAESIGAVDDDGVRRRHVDAALDDGRADQNVEAAMIEIEHELFEIALAHLAVADGDVRLRHQFADGLRGLLDGLDGVVDEVDLAAAANLAQAALRAPRFRSIPARRSSPPGARRAAS